MRGVKLVVWLCILFMLAGCATQPSAGPENTPGAAEPVETQEAPPQQNVGGRTQGLLGFVVEDDAQMATYMAMYGFLRTCENLGKPCKLYRAKDGQDAEAAVVQAAQDGCEGLLISNKQGRNDEAVRLALSLSIPVTVPYDLCEIEGLSANAVADTNAYVDELARGVAARMEERGLKTGRILLYGRDLSALAQLFRGVLDRYYPQFALEVFERTAAEDEAAVSELAEYLLYNRDIKGMYVADAGLAQVAVKGRNSAVNRFRVEGAPTPTPASTDAPAATPNPGLLTQISITVFGNGLSDENLALFEDNDIYALCIEPYYDAAAQCVMLLDKRLEGNEVERFSNVNRPLVYAATIDKYLAVYEQAKEMFGM